MLSASALRSRVEATLENRIPHALTPPQRTAPEMMPTCIPSVDALTGGVPLGCLTELCGSASSGRTSVLLALMAECMRRDEVCALVDASDAFDPQSAANAGVDLEKLLWVRCGKAISPPRHGDSKKNKSMDSLGQALKATDLLLQAGGFGLIVLDLADVPVSAARRIPLTTWFRFRRTVENTSTALVIVEQLPHVKSCASLVMDFSAQEATWSEAADQDGTSMGSHSGNLKDGVSFRVTSEGIAIPFDKPVTSSFETPQRWNSPRARLLNTLHVYLQVTRSRGIQKIDKFPIQSDHNLFFHHGDTEARRKAN